MSSLVQLDSHDDGVNAWSMARYAPTPDLAGVIDHYCDYTEHTRTFTCRRELPHAEGVLIFNFGPSVAITGGDGREIGLGTGEGFVAGVHLHPALSRSNGSQTGIQVALLWRFQSNSVAGEARGNALHRILPAPDGSSRAILDQSVNFSQRS